MMIDRKIYRGIEYIQLNELPQAQKQQLIQTIDPNLFIKILIDGSVINNCLQYKDYTYWYKTVYRPVSTIKHDTVKVSEEFKPAALAFK